MFISVACKQIYFFYSCCCCWMNISRCNSQPQPRKASEESDESLTNEKAPSPTSKHWMAFHWRLRKIETNGFGGKCDAISSKNRGWLLTNERLCHLGQITQQINGKRKYMKSCCWLWKTMHPTERKILKKVKNAKHFLESHWKSDF